MRFAQLGRLRRCAGGPGNGTPGLSVSDGVAAGDVGPIRRRRTRWAYRARMVPFPSTHLIREHQSGRRSALRRAAGSQKNPRDGAILRRSPAGHSGSDSPRFLCVTDKRKSSLMTDDEWLALVILYSKWVRASDQTVRPAALIPHPYPDLSVTRHKNLPAQELCRIGHGVPNARPPKLSGHPP